MASPMYNPPVPLNAPIPGGCQPGSLIRIQGRVLPTAHSFAIDLLSSDDIALHINPRFSEQIIVRNSCISSSWGTEERQGPSMPIFPDQNFEILILSDPSFFKIAINGQHFCEFTHRIHPLDRVSHLRVQGDLTLTLVQIEGSLTQTSSYAPTAPPVGGGGYGMGGGGGALPYPSSGGGLPQPGFNMPPTGGGGYPPPPQQAYGGGGYPPPAQGGGGYYPPPQQTMGGGGYPPQQPGGGYPPQGGYYQPGGAGPPQGGYYQPGGGAPPQQHGGGGGGGIMGSAGKLLAGGLAGVGLAKVANKIPGLGGGGGGGHHGYPGGGGGGYPGGGGHGGGGGGGLGPLGGILGGAGALGIGGALAGKAMKKDKKKGKGMMKYALPVGGALVGGYALKKGMKGFGGHHGHHGGSSSSSSSSSEEE